MFLTNKVSIEVVCVAKVKAEQANMCGKYNIHKKQNHLHQSNAWPDIGECYVFSMGIWGVSIEKQKGCSTIGPQTTVGRLNVSFSVSGWHFKYSMLDFWKFVDFGIAFGLKFVFWTLVNFFRLRKTFQVLKVWFLDFCWLFEAPDDILSAQSLFSWLVLTFSDTGWHLMHFLHFSKLWITRRL